MGGDVIEPCVEDLRFAGAVVTVSFRILPAVYTDGWIQFRRLESVRGNFPFVINGWALGGGYIVRHKVHKWRQQIVKGQLSRWCRRGWCCRGRGQAEALRWGRSPVVTTGRSSQSARCSGGCREGEGNASQSRWSAEWSGSRGTGLRATGNRSERSRRGCADSRNNGTAWLRLLQIIDGVDEGRLVDLWGRLDELH